MSSRTRQLGRLLTTYKSANDAATNDAAVLNSQKTNNAELRLTFIDIKKQPNDVLLHQPSPGQDHAADHYQDINFFNEAALNLQLVERDTSSFIF